MYDHMIDANQLGERVAPGDELVGGQGQPAPA